MIVVSPRSPASPATSRGCSARSTRRDGYLEGRGYLVTWAIGHLVGTRAASRDEPAWKTLVAARPCRCCRREFPLVVLDDRRATSTRSSSASSAIRPPRSVVAATDAGREGELIFRYIYEARGLHEALASASGSRRSPPTRSERRSRVSSRARGYDRLADAATARSRADWLVGMNLRRAYSVARRDALLRGPRPDADARDGRRARSRDSRVRSRALRRGRSDASSGQGARTKARGTRVPRRASERRAASSECRSRRRRGCLRMAKLARAIVERAEEGQRLGRRRRSKREAHAAAAALRSHRAPAPREPALRPHGEADARCRAGALRTPQGAQLSAYRQPASLERGGRDAAAIVEAISPRYSRL